MQQTSGWAIGASLYVLWTHTTTTHRGVHHMAKRRQIETAAGCDCESSIEDRDPCSTTRDALLSGPKFATSHSALLRHGLAYRLDFLEGQLWTGTSDEVQQLTLLLVTKLSKLVLTVPALSSPKTWLWNFTVWCELASMHMSPVSHTYDYLSRFDLVQTHWICKWVMDCWFFHHFFSIGPIHLSSKLVLIRWLLSGSYWASRSFIHVQIEGRGHLRCKPLDKCIVQS